MKNLIKQFLKPNWRKMRSTSITNIKLVIDVRGNIRRMQKLLKPNWRKIILLAIFVILSSFITHHGMDCMTFGGGCTHINGFPFSLYSIHYSTAMPYPQSPTISYNPLFIILNIIFWYLISSVIISTYDKLRKTKQ